MPIWLQHLLALALVASCAAMLAWQTVRSLRGSGKLGRCCAKGCDAASTPTQPAADGVLFLPSNWLRRRR